LKEILQSLLDITIILKYNLSIFITFLIIIIMSKDNSTSIENQKSINEQNIKKYLCKIEFPIKTFGKGILCKMPHLNYGTINVLFTNHEFKDIEDPNSNKKIKLYLSDGNEIYITLNNKENQTKDKASFREFYQDEESGMTMIEIKDGEIDNFLEYDKDYCLYDNMEVYLLNFCLSAKLDLSVGIILENENLMNPEKDNNNKIGMLCFKKNKSSGGIMLYDGKIIGFHYGNNNIEGKYWNSCMYLFHFIKNYYQKNNWPFLFKHKRKDGKETTNQNNQNDQNKQNEQKNDQLKDKNNLNNNPLKKMLYSSYSPFLKNSQLNINQGYDPINDPKNQQVNQQLNNPMNHQKSNQQVNPQNNYYMNYPMNQQKNSPKNPKKNQQMGQQMSQQISQQVNNQMSQQINNQMNQQINNQMNQQINNQMNQQINNQMNQQINNQISQQINNKINQQINNQMNQQINNQMNQQINNQMNQQINNQMNQQINNPMNQQMNRQNLFPQNNLNVFNPKTGSIRRKINFPNINNFSQNNNFQNIKSNYLQNNNPIPSSHSIKFNNPLNGQYNNAQNLNHNMNYYPNINPMNPNQNYNQNMNYIKNNQAQNNNNFIHK